MFGPRAAKAQLFRKVAAQRPGDEQQSLAVLDRFAELAVRARKERRLPCHELIGLDASREQDSVPSVATELAFQLTRTDCRDISQRAQSEKIKSLELLGVERQLTRSNRREECSSVFHRHQATRPRARRGESRGERAGRETEPRFAPDRLQQSPPHLADRIACLCDAAQLQPRHTFVAHLDDGREVVQRARDQLANPSGRFFIGQNESRLRAKMLRLPQRHAGHDPKLQRLL